METITLKEAEDRGMVPMTKLEPGRGTLMARVDNGNSIRVSYYDWCLMERNRLRSMGFDAEIALAEGPVYQRRDRGKVREASRGPVIAVYTSYNPEKQR